MENLASLTFCFLAVLVLAGSAYQAVSAMLLRRMSSAAWPELSSFPPVTVLKPLCGDEPSLESNLRSFCLQDYPAFQIVFGVHDAVDPAIAVVEKLRREFPDLSISLAVGQGRPGSGNPKVANLMDMFPEAKHDILVLSDSDTFADPSYLKALVGTLMQPDTGIATSLYVGQPMANFWSRIGAMGINHNFLPQVAVAQLIGRQDGCFGAAIAIRRQTLEEIGGLAQVRDLLADDYYLGAAVRKLGRNIRLAPTWPRCTEFEPDFKTLFRHEVRWGRTLASIEWAGYAFSLVTIAFPFALIGLLLDGGGPRGWLFLAIAMLARLWSVRSEESSLKLEPEPAWMILFRDLFSVAVHLTALSGKTIYWRNQRMRLGPDGSLLPLKPSAKSP